jgi:hypothetical protein
MPLERSTLYSPAWFVPFDEYNQRVRSTGVSVELDRWDDGTWLRLDNAAVRTPSGALAYPGLGRRGEPASAQPQRHRARFAAPGYQPLYPADGQPFDADLAGAEFLVHPHNDAVAPPETEPRVVRLLPSVSFPYPPGIRTVRGVVLDAAPGNLPIANALVEARGTAQNGQVDWHERTLSDAAGAFRLALRWEGERDEQPFETFRLRATQRPGRAGELVIRLPGPSGTKHVIEISEQ